MVCFAIQFEAAGNSTSSPGGRTSYWLHKTHTHTKSQTKAVKRDESEEDERAIRLSVNVSWFSGFPQEYSSSTHSCVYEDHVYYVILYCLLILVTVQYS